MGVDGISGIAVDVNSRKICLIIKKGERLESRVVLHQDILSAEMLEDGFQMVKVSRRFKNRGAIPEEIPAGGTGEIIDENSATTAAVLKNTADKVRTIELNLLVNDIQDPIHTITFSNTENEKGSVGYTVAVTAARQWHSRLCVLMQQADNEDENVENRAENAGEIQSVADEINKLAELMNNGLITEEEFNLQKAKLLQEP